jgi:hypothetical protein
LPRDIAGTRPAARHNQHGLIQTEPLACTAMVDSKKQNGEQKIKLHRRNLQCRNRCGAKESGSERLTATRKIFQQKDWPFTSHCLNMTGNKRKIIIIIRSWKKNSKLRTDL